MAIAFQVCSQNNDLAKIAERALRFLCVLPLQMLSEVKLVDEFAGFNSNDEGDITLSGKVRLDALVTSGSKTSMWAGWSEGVLFGGTVDLRPIDETYPVQMTWGCSTRHWGI